MTKPHRTRILIADDHPVYRAGLLQILKPAKSIEVVCETGDGSQVLALAARHKPDLVMSDIEMPGMTGLDIARERRKLGLPFELVFLTMYSDQSMFDEALSLGVKGYVLKESATTDIVQCIESVSQGGSFVSPALTQMLLNQRLAHVQLKNEKPGLDLLTATEFKVLRMIARDMTSKEIAGELGISPKTVDNHRTNMCGKLGLYGSHSLLKFAYDHKGEL